jgi:hypothetical protein
MSHSISSTIVLLLALLATIAAPSTGQVSGVVLDTEGNGIAGATVTLLADSGQIAMQQTDHAGAFRFTLDESAGAVSVRAQSDGYRSALMKVGGPTHEAELRLSSTGFGEPWHDQIAQDVSVTLIRANGQRWDMGEGMDQVVAPGDLVAGETFVLELTSYGSGSCTRPDRVIAAADREFLTVVVIDEVKGGVCTMDRVAFPREIRHQFDVLGPKVIRVVGLRGDLVISVSVQAN